MNLETDFGRSQNLQEETEFKQELKHELGTQHEIGPIQWWSRVIRC